MTKSRVGCCCCCCCSDSSVVVVVAVSSTLELVVSLLSVLDPIVNPNPSFGKLNPVAGNKSSYLGKSSVIPSWKAVRTLFHKEGDVVVGGVVTVAGVVGVSVSASSSKAS
ncbi:hypothetical protein WICPIJ_003292 [Wickerhamomyces pijperi]|uniref:Uncharacterized protein n=1 Tax=Wickerhamomyces pijperi TaxID=599730 RepID=A0A9P8TN55_WICPI|nr:hypothetical protein WICPIJ_003292 [Wickerhamomyces pijperi]